MHHYTQYMDIEHFDTCLESCTNVIKLYEDLEREKKNHAAELSKYKLLTDKLKFQIGE